MEPRSAGRPADIDDRLLRIRARGFTFRASRDGSGSIVGLVGVRVHHGIVDIVRINGPDDVSATRVPGDEPNVLRPRAPLWRASGSAGDVLDELLGLPDPTPDEGTQQSLGCWVPVGPGRLVWLAATDQT